MARIRPELLDAECDMPALLVISTALPLMDIVPEPSWALPQRPLGHQCVGIFLASLEPKSCPYA